MRDALNDADAERQKLAQNFDVLEHCLAAGYCVDGSISGTELDPRQHSAAVLFTSGLTQTIAILKIAPDPSQQRQLYDPVAVAVLVRALAETYLSFRYSGYEPNTFEEYEFRRKFSQFHGAHKAWDMARRFGMPEIDLIALGARRTLLHSELVEDSLFKALPEGDQKRFVKDDHARHLTLSQLSANAGIKPSAWQTIYGFLSQYAHANAFSFNQLKRLNADSAEANTTLSMLVQLAAGFISKFVIDMEVLFPGCGELIDSEQRQWLTVESSVLEAMGVQRIDS